MRFGMGQGELDDFINSNETEHFPFKRPKGRVDTICGGILLS